METEADEGADLPPGRAMKGGLEHDGSKDENLLDQDDPTFYGVFERDYKALPDADRAMVLKFAEFLDSQTPLFVRRAVANALRIIEKSEECPAGGQIVMATQFVAELLLDKNKKYGNSALEPVRVFSEADTLEQIRVRQDDKLSRLMADDVDDSEDAKTDLLGYFVLELAAVFLRAGEEMDDLLERFGPWTRDFGSTYGL